jgi:integrase
MAVYQQGEYWYTDFVWRDPATGAKKRIRRLAKDEKQRPVKSKTAAEGYENRVRGQLAAGTFERSEEEIEQAAEPALTVGDFWERYTREHVARNEPSSRSAYETIWRNSLKPVVAGAPLKDVGAPHYAKVAARMRERGRGPKTINNALSCLRTALDMAREWGLRGHVVPVRWEKVPEPEIEFFDAADIDKLVGVGDPMVTFALKTGLRLGELLALPWAAVDMKNERVTVSRSVWWRKGKAHEKHTKSGRIRVIPLPPSALEALKTLRSQKSSEELSGDRHVFTNERGAMLTANGCKWPLWRVCDAAGVERCRWHKLRHSYVSALVSKGVPLPQVQKLAGHARIEMTMRYTHVSADHLRDAVSVLE